MGVWHTEWADGRVDHREWKDETMPDSIMKMTITPEEELQLLRIMAEYRRARKMHAPMHSAHEGYATILEELDEMWDAIKANDIPHARKECLQVAAMCLAFLLEVKE